MDLSRRESGIKQTLLNQTVISGVGNIYADEALWRSRLNYLRPAQSLSQREVDRLLAELRAVFADAWPWAERRSMRCMSM